MSETSTGSSITAHLNVNTGSNKPNGDAKSLAVSVPSQVIGVNLAGTHHAAGNIPGIGAAFGSSGIGKVAQQVIEDEQLDSASALAVAMTAGKYKTY